MKLNISIITCAYNRDKEIFIRTLNAVSRLDRQNIATEGVFMDNISKTPIEEHSYVQEFLSENSWAYGSWKRSEH